MAIAVLAAVLLGSACVAAPRPTREVTPAGASGAEVSATPTEGTSPPLNSLEVKIIAALSRLGFTGRRAQDSADRSASISAEVSPGSLLFVSAAATGAFARDYTVVEERQIEGVRVLHVRYSGNPIDHLFGCAGDTYLVRGALPPGFQDMDAFVAGFIRALGCAA